MRILVLGGTRFVGRHLALEALARGHDVTMLHRGRTCGGLFPEARHLHADRDGALGELAGARWDLTLDVCAYRPDQVRGLARALDGRGGRVVFVSTVSVYAPPPAPGADEDTQRITLEGPDPTEVTEASYGGLKTRCEDVAKELFGQEVLVLRPTYVVGPHDHTGRLPYWVLRLARGGEVLAPGPPESPVQWIDARDLATFAIDLAERGASGGLHTVSPAPPFGMGDLLEAIAAEVAPAGTRLRWIAESTLRAAGEDGRTLPLWSGTEPDRFVLALDPARARAAGLRPRPLAETIRDTLAWAATTRAAIVADVGLTPERERDLLAAN
jgi:2'-hydroxyisoflavone reductase